MNNMISEIEIAKYIFPLDIKDEKNIDWKTIALGFAVFENDPKPLYAEIYKLELADPEEIISKLPELHELFVEELAEAYVLDKSKVANIELLESPLFIEKANFYSTLKNVITKQERQRIINEFPISYEGLSSFSEKELEGIVKKKARTDLKDKFKKWDEELKEEKSDVVFYSLAKKSKQKGKVISLSWVKYAVAASIVIMAGLFYFKSFNTIDNTVNVIANVESSTQTVLVIVNQGLGYISNEENQQVEVVFMDHTNRIVSINKMLNNNVDDDLAIYKKELDHLKLIENTYIFNKKQLTINLKMEIQQLSIIHLNQEAYYLKLNNLFYKISKTDLPTELVSESNQSIIEQIEKTIFENE